MYLPQTVANDLKRLERFYEISIWQSMQVENGMLYIPIPPREFHPCPQDNKALRRALYEAYDEICPYCGKAIPSQLEMQVDHISPRKYRENLAFKRYAEYLKACGFDVKNPNYIENYFPAHGS